MSREIKFRAWDSHCRYFIKFGKDFWFDDNVSTLTFQCDLVQGDRDHNGTRFIFEQFTGLKDKNGKEIYEGDLLEHWCGSDKQDNLFLVESLIDVHLAINDKDGYTRIHTLKIVGNIHENPELLEKKAV